MATPTLAESVTSATAAVVAASEAYHAKEERVALREADMVLASGLAANANDPTELAQAASLGPHFLAVAGGSANVLSVKLAGGVPWPALLADMEFVLPTLGPNTGPVTVAVTGFTVVPPAAAGSGLPAGTLQLLNRSGGQLAQGDLTGASVKVRANGAGALVLAGTVASDIGAVAPVFPPASGTFYVRPDGSDANDGSAGTAAKAFATVGGALAAIAKRYALSASPVTLQLALTGAYPLPAVMPTFNGTINIQGDAANPLNYSLTGSGSASGGSGVLSIYSGTLGLNGLTLNNTGTNNNGLNAQQNGAIVCTNVAFTGTASGWAHGLAANGGSLTIGTGCQIRSSGSAAFTADGGNLTIQSGSVITLANTPAFSTGFAVAVNNGTIKTGGGISFPGSGATGPRYYSTANGTISVSGQGANFFPGSTAGTADQNNGGRYS